MGSLRLRDCSGMLVLRLRPNTIWTFSTAPFRSSRVPRDALISNRSADVRLASTDWNLTSALVKSYRIPCLLSSSALAAVSGVTKLGPVKTVSCEGIIPYLI